MAPMFGNLAYRAAHGATPIKQLRAVLKPAARAGDIVKRGVAKRQVQGDLFGFDEATLQDEGEDRGQGQGDQGTVPENGCGGDGDHAQIDRVAGYFVWPLNDEDAWGVVRLNRGLLLVKP